jgi:Transposase
MNNFAAFIGIDWADDKHDLCLVDCSTDRKEFHTITHKPEALDKFLFQLRARFSGRLIAVALEQARGPLIFALLKYDFLLLFPIHTTTLAKYREAFSPSRAKDDPKDAEFLNHNLRPFLSCLAFAAVAQLCIYAVETGYGRLFAAQKASDSLANQSDHLSNSLRPARKGEQQFPEKPYHIVEDGQEKSGPGRR